MESIFFLPSLLVWGILFEVERLCIFVYGGETWSLHSIDIYVSVCLYVSACVCVCFWAVFQACGLCLSEGGPAVLHYWFMGLCSCVGSGFYRPQAQASESLLKCSQISRNGTWADLQITPLCRMKEWKTYWSRAVFFFSGARPLKE